MTKELSEKEEERIRKLRDDFVDEVDSVGYDDDALKQLDRAAKKYMKKRSKTVYMRPESHPQKYIPQAVAPGEEIDQY